jgi:hypothetical protein
MPNNMRKLLVCGAEFLNILVSVDCLCFNYRMFLGFVKIIFTEYGNDTDIRRDHLIVRVQKSPYIRIASVFRKVSKAI